VVSLFSIQTIYNNNLKNKTIMLNRIIRAVAGTFIIISLLLAVYVNINWLWFTAFVGANLLQSSITKWCLMEDILKKFGVKD
jgi:ABC-type Fe3+-siderophore transport system permease subunit